MRVTDLEIKKSYLEVPPSGHYYKHYPELDGFPVNIKERKFEIRKFRHADGSVEMFGVSIDDQELMNVLEQMTREQIEEKINLRAKSFIKSEREKAIIEIKNLPWHKRLFNLF